MRYLITGGAGFIGSNLAHRLLENNNDVIIVDNLLTGRLSNVPPEAEFLELDIGAPDVIQQLPDTPVDAVLHLGAQSSGEISFERPEYDVLTNTLGSLNLLRWCMATGTQRFVYASSMSVYGDVGDDPIAEDHCPQPKSFYGITKLAGEHYVNAFSRQGLKTTIFRMFNVYGPGQNLENLKQGMVSIYLSFVLNEKLLLVRGSSQRFRDLVYIDDVVAAWLTVLQNPASFGRTYNLGSGTKTYVHELVRGILLAFGKDPETYPVQYAEGTPGDQFGIWADVRRITEEVCWSAQVGLSQGLRTMARWAMQTRL